MTVHGGIPETLVPYLQEYDAAALDLERDADVIIGRALEFGTRAELRWLFQRYGRDRMATFVRRRGFRTLSRRAFNYWRLILDVGEFERPPWLSESTRLWDF